jgi:ankyrin repeat protein
MHRELVALFLVTLLFLGVLFLNRALWGASPPPPSGISREELDAQAALLTKLGLGGTGLGGTGLGGTGLDAYTKAVVELAKKLSSAKMTRQSIVDAVNPIITVQASVPSSVNKNALVQDDKTALMVASSKGYTPLVALLLSIRVSLDAKDARGKTALMMASEGGYSPIVALLLGAAADMSAKTIEGYTAVGFSATLAVAHLFQAFGANLDDASSRLTPLMAAAQRGDVAAATSLLDAGASIDSKGSLGETALMLAAGSNRTDVMVMLLGKNADVNATTPAKETALMKCGSVDCVKALVKARAAMDTADDQNQTALLHFLKAGKPELGVELLSAAPVSARTIQLTTPVSGSKLTALMYAAGHADAGVVKTLLDHAPQDALFAQDAMRMTALMFAVKRTDYPADIVKTILTFARDPTVIISMVDNTDTTVLMHAVKSADPSVVRMLLNYPNLQALIEMTDLVGQTALVHAAQRNDAGIVQALLESPSTPRDLVHARDQFRMTALMHAARRKDAGIVNALLNNSSNRKSLVDMTDSTNKTALMYAAQYSTPMIVSILLSNSDNRSMIDADGKAAEDFALLNSAHRSDVQRTLET